MLLDDVCVGGLTSPPILTKSPIVMTALLPPKESKLIGIACGVVGGTYAFIVVVVQQHLSTPQICLMVVVVVVVVLYIFVVVVVVGTQYGGSWLAIHRTHSPIPKVGDCGFKVIPLGGRGIGGGIIL